MRYSRVNLSLIYVQSEISSRIFKADLSLSVINKKSERDVKNIMLQKTNLQ